MQSYNPARQPIPAGVLDTHAVICSHQKSQVKGCASCDCRARLRSHRAVFVKVAVRYRPNAASGGWGYGVTCVTAVKRGYTRFDIILLNIHKTTSRWYCMAVVLRPRLLTFACLARHPANCSTALPKVFSSDLPVC